MANSYQDVIARQVELSYVPPHNFYMVIDKIPEVVFTCQQLTIPTISTGEALLSNRYNPSKTYIPGDGIDYSNLEVTFILDKHFRNYRSILKWMKGNAVPDDPKQWVVDKFSDTMSNITVYGSDSANVPLIHWNFVSCFPVSLDGVNFDSTIPDVTYLTSNVSFRYHYFTNNTYTNGQLNNDEI